MSSQMKLGTLHTVLQGAFGWYDYHLHQFEAGGKVWGPASMEECDHLPMADEDKITIGRTLRVVGDSMLYTYDFGDDWRHKVTLERVIPDPAASFPDASCLAGRRAGPQEDCGGPWGYQRLLKVLSDPEDEEYAEMKEWVSAGFDPEVFDMSEINERLATVKV